MLRYSHAWGRDQGSPAHIPLSLQVQLPDPASIRVLRGHQLPVTCLVISPDDRFIFSASKDGSLIKCKCSLRASTACSPSLNPAGTLQQQDRECLWKWLSPRPVWGPACASFWALKGSFALPGVVGGSQG